MSTRPLPPRPLPPRSWGEEEIPTPRQWLDWVRAVPEERLAEVEVLVANLIDGQQQATVCFLEDHVARLTREVDSAPLVAEAQEAIGDVLRKFQHYNIRLMREAGAAVRPVIEAAVRAGRGQ